jgi:flagellar basal-body rod modification protein FlgD
MATNPVGGTGGTSGDSSQKSPDAALRNMDMQQFLKLMITELQNQDPLNPADNAAILEQINTLRQIASSDKMTETMESMLMGQQLSSAGNLLGKQIRAIDEKGVEFTGAVDKVSVVDGVAKVYSGTKSASLTNVREVLNAASSS